MVWLRISPLAGNRILALSKLKAFADDNVSATQNLKVPIPATWKGVCLQNTSKSHSYQLKIWYLL